MAYIFDTNIFIRSKNEMPMEVWPTFWRRMAEMINSGQVYSSIEVKAEYETSDPSCKRRVKIPDACNVSIQQTPYCENC